MGAGLTVVLVGGQPQLFYNDALESSASVQYAVPTPDGWQISTVTTSYPLPVQIAAYVDPSGPHPVFPALNDLDVGTLSNGTWTLQQVAGPDSTIAGHDSDQVLDARPAVVPMGSDLDFFYSAQVGSAPNATAVVREARQAGSTWMYTTIDGAGASTTGATTDSVGDSIGALWNGVSLDVWYGLNTNTYDVSLRLAELADGTWQDSDFDGGAAGSNGELAEVTGIPIGLDPAPIILPSGPDEVFYGGGYTLRAAVESPEGWQYDTLPAYNYEQNPGYAGSGDDAVPDLEVESIGVFRGPGGHVYSNELGATNSSATVDLDQVPGANHDLGGTTIGAPAVVTVPQAGAALMPIYFAVGPNRAVYLRSGSQGWRLFGSAASCQQAVTASVEGSAVTAACRSVHNGLRYLTATIPDVGLPTGGRWHGVHEHLTGEPGVATVRGKLAFYLPVAKHRVRKYVPSTKRSAPTPWRCSGGVSAATRGSTAGFVCREPKTERVVYSVIIGSTWSKLIPAEPQESLPATGRPAIALTSKGPQFFWPEANGLHAYVTYGGSGLTNLRGAAGGFGAAPAE